MIEIRFHGRGGQGAVTAAALLAKAAGYDDKYAQGFPAFGVERRGAPVKAFARISDNPITLRSQIYNPDYVVVLDSSLMGLKEVTEGLKKESVIIVNAETMENKTGHKLYCYDATSLALDVLGKNIVNTVMLGVFAKITKLVSLGSLLKVIETGFPEKLSGPNKVLIERAYKECEGYES
ncbi:MAG: pyruvate ferredoxin oxidoreductase [Candidatus Aenigmatarchaeota archaeon]|nr:MAG: pyruvate ferredoxin oxidoreductase [Candidatus Aenigmarchaeota archaeon]